MEGEAKSKLRAHASCNTASAYGICIIQTDLEGNPIPPLPCSIVPIPWCCEYLHRPSTILIRCYLFLSSPSLHRWILSTLTSSLPSGI